MNAEQIAAERARRAIPNNVAVTFEDTTNNDLIALSEDMQVSAQIRLWARAEVEYRAANGIYYDLDPGRDYRLRRRVFETGAEAARGFAEDDAVMERLPKVDRNYYRADVAAERMRARLEAAPDRVCDACGATFKALLGPDLCTSCWTAYMATEAAKAGRR